MRPVAFLTIPLTTCKDLQLPSVRFVPGRRPFSVQRFGFMDLTSGSSRVGHGFGLDQSVEFIGG